MNFETVATAFGGGRAPIVIALTTGIITAFNPCGFAMLPAYVSYFIGQTGTTPRPLASRLVRAAITGAVVTAGFMTVFGTIGLIATQFLTSINSVVPYVSMVVGVTLAVLGIVMLRGFEPKLSFLKVTKVRNGSSLRSMYVYGLSYAIVSLSCGFAGFLTTVVSASSERSWLSSMTVYAAFTAGMGLVLIVLSFAVAFAQQAFVKGMRKVLPYVNRASGAMLIVAGLYVAYYGYYEWTTILRGKAAPAGPVSWVQDWSASILATINNLSTPVFIAVLATVSTITIFAVIKRTATRPEPQQQGIE